MLSTILIVILILLLIGALPAWPYSTGWGYYPGGGIGLILIIVLILALMGQIWAASHRQESGVSSVVDDAVPESCGYG
jgi:hypothetical protein